MTPKLIDDSVVGEREKFLVYGRMGTGKTFSAGTMPGNVYVLVLGGFNEVKTLRSKDFREKYPDKEGKLYLDYVKESLGKRGIFMQANAYDWACDKLDEALELEEKGDFQFDSLVIDSATMMRSFAMNKAIEITSDLAKSADKTALTRLKTHGIVLAGDQDWGAEQSLMWKFINWCFELDKHFLLITHEWNAEKHSRGTREVTITSVKPLFTGKHRVEIPQMFDNVWRFTVSGGERSRVFEAQTVGDDIIDAKTRMGGIIGAVERDINYTKIIGRWKAYTQGN